MTLLAELIAKYEGWGVEGAKPTRNNNPGDLTHAPGETHDSGDPNGVGAFETAAAGWAALERQLQLYAERGLTLEQAIYQYAPPGSNDTLAYLQFVCEGLKCSSTIPMSNALEIQG